MHLTQFEDNELGQSIHHKPNAYRQSKVSNYWLMKAHCPFSSHNPGSIAPQPSEQDIFRLQVSMTYALPQHYSRYAKHEALDAG
jgi:hypothetical protein